MSDRPHMTAAELPAIWRRAIRDLAQTQALICRAWVFGSHVKGTAGPDSDVDIAVELTSPRDRLFADFISEHDRWQAALSRRIDREVDLQLYDREEAPHVFACVNEASVQVYP